MAEYGNSRHHITVLPQAKSLCGPFQKNARDEPDGEKGDVALLVWRREPRPPDQKGLDALILMVIAYGALIRWGSSELGFTLWKVLVLCGLFVGYLAVVFLWALPGS